MTLEQKPNTKNILKTPTEGSLKSLRYPLTTDFKKVSTNDKIILCLGIATHAIKNVCNLHAVHV